MESEPEGLEAVETYENIPQLFAVALDNSEVFCSGRAGV